MDIPYALLGNKQSCTCGRDHQVPIEKIVIDERMLEQLPPYLAGESLNQVLLVADANTYRVFGDQVYQHLLGAGVTCDVHVFQASHDLLPDEQAIAAIRQAVVQSSATVVLAVGSGVINDVARYASYSEGIPYIVIPTAPSMDGYASSVAALQFNGVKTTLPAHTPKAIFVQPEVLSDAPFELIQAGFGDLIGKTISLLDWKLSHVLFGEYFCTKSYEMVLTPLQYCVEHAVQVRDRDQTTIKNLFVGLINAGIAMAMMGNSRPCSGSEHHCSHYWDLLAYQGVRPHASHGLQVGYAVQWMIRFYRVFAKASSIEAPLSPALTPEREAQIRAFYGDGANEILTVFRDKVSWYHEHNGDFQTRDIALVLQKLEPELSMLPAVERALRDMNIPEMMDALGLTVDILRETFLHANELRSRYTIFDFLVSQGELDGATRNVLAILEVAKK
ncbi:sn-glycerol-1-phosphate dehydrogenase [Alicyclobacillus fastidiosus]|uniref:Sn-glycerol-1-phosphate dehydrogenase n=1 Tax=Alicyclobacillus fastidiosus TaxID=392011 RepID=A0ABV5A929_9BACL|nr:sn-glycerol-1-phosphate dehydrogenase [Alicyclobacillus fastidiosus]WEH10736.1 sn-glycerol-1-phosphate dehydrogenase [Alicyclobacillus fastidiosus]